MYVRDIKHKWSDRSGIQATKTNFIRELLISRFFDNGSDRASVLVAVGSARAPSRLCVMCFYFV